MMTSEAIWTAVLVVCVGYSMGTATFAALGMLRHTMRLDALEEDLDYLRADVMDLEDVVQP